MANEYLNDKEGMTRHARVTQLKWDILHINNLVFPSNYINQYAKLTDIALIKNIEHHLQDGDDFLMECDLVTIGWLVIAFYIGQYESRYTNPQIVNFLYVSSRMGSTVGSDEFMLFRLALEIGTRILNGEGDVMGFEESEFNFESHAELCQVFRDQHASPNQKLYDAVLLKIRALKFLKKDPKQTDRVVHMNDKLYKESSILNRIMPPKSYSSIRAVLNRAINAVDPLWEMFQDKDLEYKTKLKSFKAALCDLKSEILMAYQNGQCDPDCAAILSNLVFELAEHIEKKTLEQGDIDHFIKATNQYRTIASIDAKLNQLIYTAVAIIPLLCAVAVMLAGAGVAGTLGAAAITFGIGEGAGRYMIWEKNKTMVKKIDDVTEAARPLLIM